MKIQLANCKKSPQDDDFNWGLSEGEKDRNVAQPRTRTDRDELHRQIIEEWKVVTTADAKVDEGEGG